MSGLLNKDKVFIFSSAFLVLVGILSIIDVFMDKNDQLSNAHIIGEFFLIFLSFSGSFYFISQASFYRESSDKLKTQVNSLEKKNSHYKEQVQLYKNGLSEAIDEEFNLWKLTPSEKEVGIMLIKGMSYNEIAEARGISERTARNQGSSLLSKAGLKNKSELIAYFLEDLLYPKI